MTFDDPECVMKKSELLDIKMAGILEVKKEKKTRRGKKKGRNSGTVFGKGNEYVPTTFLPHSCRNHPYSNVIHKKPLHMFGSRPLSPKAPQNSTQFLIEDSGNDKIDVEQRLPVCLSTFQLMDMVGEPKFEDYSEKSLYDDEIKATKGAEEEYSPICELDTDNFIADEFEREFNLEVELTSKNDTHRKTRELKSCSKDEIVRRLLALEDRLQSIELGETKCLKQKINDLKSNNMKLIQENYVLENCVLYQE
ncbi:hypothetical protein DPMN_096444 [Dreissena polymorpha]|uniref:Uncharacterized protein n=1 Tax=Dreissena polymorpha TaxID=45954 RepID=A0A9D4R3N5_DREPO|nr:hypothetical protein DPMN_096444 [Dreissena polymorpha]